MNKELVSVLISSYNHEKYIKETLNSIIKQTYKNIELLVIDDGSKDQTYERILEMESALRERFVRVHIEKQENMGVSRTTYKLVKLSKGEYIYVIASDDALMPNAVEVCANYLINNPDCGLVAGDSYFIDENSNIVCMDENREIVSSKSFHSFHTVNENSRERLLRLYGKKIGNRFDLEKLDFLEYRDFWFDDLIPVNNLLRADVFDKVIPHNVNCPTEDVFIHCQIAKFYKIKVLPEVLSYYRLHSTNTMKNLEYVNFITRMTRLYELYLLDTKYPEFKTENLKDSWWYKLFYDEWEKSKNSPYWDEQYYINKYPEVLEQGYIPLVHYLTLGKEKKFFPSRYYEKRKWFVRKGVNLLIVDSKNYINKLRRRLKALLFSFLVFISLLPGINLVFKKKRKIFISKMLDELSKHI